MLFALVPLNQLKPGLGLQPQLSVDPGVTDAEYGTWFAGHEGFSPFQNANPDPGLDYSDWTFMNNSARAQPVLGM